MEKARLDYLIHALNEGSITTEEHSELLQYYNSFQLSNDWDEEKMGAQEEVKDRIYLAVKGEDNGEVGRIYPWRQFLRWAAACLLVASVSWLTYQMYTQPVEMIVVSTGKESKEVLLPDGTRVMLNVNSQLTYPAKFSKARREVKFEGEGYFDVETDSLHPFVIDVDMLKVKVMGTVFNLKSYKDDPRVETSLIEGKVVLMTKDEKTALSVLAPHQKFIAEKGDLETIASAKTVEDKITIEPIQFIDENPEEPVDLAWKDGKLAFSSAPLADIARMLKRKHDVNVKIVDPTVADYKYTGAFDGETVDDILNVLRLVKQFKYRKEGNDIIIY